MSDKFADFERTDLPFGDANGTPLQATVWTPKSLLAQPSAKYAVLVYWHGGGFVVGHRAYEGWYAPWLLQLALKKPCLIIAPDYRLLPEANAAEILADVRAFWTWLRDSASNLNREWHAQIDLDQIACAGTSAGGYLAVQSALMFQHLVKIRVLISVAGSLHNNIPYYRIPGPKVILGKPAPPPRKAEEIVRRYLKTIKPGAVRLSGDPLEMWEFLTCVLQQAYLRRWMGVGDNDELDIMKNLSAQTRLPPIWVVQGDKDSVVPPLCATGFVDKLREVCPDTAVMLTLEPGDHGFEVNYDDQTPWVADGMEFVRKHWDNATDTDK